MSIRLFTAIDLPEPVKNALTILCSGVPGAKWVKRDQMHLTLRFIGDVDEKQFTSIRDVLGGIQIAPFQIRLESVGQFPPKGAPRVLWVGVQAPDILGMLYQQIESALTSLGLEPENRPYSPHITLARLKTAPPPDAMRTFFSRHAQFQTGSIPVDSFILYSSTLTPNGSIYRKEAIYPLKNE